MVGKVIRSYEIESQIGASWLSTPSSPLPLAPGGPVSRVVAAAPRALDLTIPQYFLAGGVTGFFSTLLECPIDLFKSQLQTQIFRDKLDTDQNQATSQQFQVRGIPTLIVFKGGKEVARQVGAVPKAMLEALLAKAAAA